MTTDPSAPPLLAELASYLDEALQTERFGDDQRGVFRPSARPVRRLGAALEPWPGLAAWAGQARVDALFLHRPWRLEPGQLAPDIGVLAYHLAFDERLTVGMSAPLADALGMANIQPLGGGPGRPIGMIGNCSPATFSDWRERISGMFGGLDESIAPATGGIERVAAVGAMTDALVRAAAEQGAQLYLTGQLRAPARAAVATTGVGVLAVGHRRAERWGLGALAGLLRARWPGLAVVLAPDPAEQAGAGDA